MVLVRRRPPEASPRVERVELPREGPAALHEADDAAVVDAKVDGS